MTLQQIADHYQTTKTRVRKWFDKLGIPKNKQGGGNNRKVIDNISEEDLRKMVSEGLTNKKMSQHIGCSVSNVCRLLSKYGIKRDYKTPEYAKYNRKVRLLTEKVYADNMEKINPDNHPRTLCGVPGGYQLDHIVPIRECFDKNISPEQAADVSNLQMITWEKNLQKRYDNG